MGAVQKYFIFGQRLIKLFPLHIRRKSVEKALWPGYVRQFQSHEQVETPRHIRLQFKRPHSGLLKIFYKKFVSLQIKRKLKVYVEYLICICYNYTEI